MNPDRKKFTSLNSKHTHLILVDDGSEGEFGGEVELRALFEASARQAVGSGDEPLIIEEMEKAKMGWHGCSTVTSYTQTTRPCQSAHLLSLLGSKSMAL